MQARGACASLTACVWLCLGFSAKFNLDQGYLTTVGN